MREGGEAPRKRIGDVEGAKGMVGGKIGKDPQYPETTDTEYAYKHGSYGVPQASYRRDCHLLEGKDEIDCKDISDPDHCVGYDLTFI